MAGMTPTCRLFLNVLFCLSSVDAAKGTPRLESLPEAGLQPQVAVAADGKIHLVYLTGKPEKADIRHVWKAPGGAWSRPVTVDREPGTAIAVGTIRGAQIALSAGDGTIHVVWNGTGGKGRPSALFYARSIDGGASFSGQRDLRGDTGALDGGATVAAGAGGDVAVVWHGSPEGAAPGESSRRVFVARSRDGGVSFGAPAVVSPDGAGVCACCSLEAAMAANGGLSIVYRSALADGRRDATLLEVPSDGGPVSLKTLGPWSIPTCPMSSASLLIDGRAPWAAWETEGEIVAANLAALSKGVTVSGGKARHPALARNNRGEILVSWSIGTGWLQDGGFGWAILDADGKMIEKGASRDGIPVWSHTAAYAEGNGFVLLH